MEFFDNEKKLFGTALAFFVGLTILVAILPAIYNQKNNAPLPNAIPLTADAMAGEKHFCFKWLCGLPHPTGPQCGYG